MKSILEELYMGNVGFDSGYYSQNSPFVKAARKKADNMEKLMETLNDSQKELFENYCDAQGDIAGITRYDTFTASLKFGALFMIELLTNSGEVTGEGGADE